jgi:hypothetical protein
VSVYLSVGSIILKNISIKYITLQPRERKKIKEFTCLFIVKENSVDAQQDLAICLAPNNGLFLG